MKIESNTESKEFAMRETHRFKIDWSSINCKVLKGTQSVCLMDTVELYWPITQPIRLIS